MSPFRELRSSEEANASTRARISCTNWSCNRLSNRPGMIHFLATRFSGTKGGWIYMDNTTGMVAVRPVFAGAQASSDLGTPPVVPGAVVVATFHTHPNPSAEEWEPRPARTTRNRHGFSAYPVHPCR